MTTTVRGASEAREIGSRGVGSLVLIAREETGIVAKDRSTRAEGVLICYVSPGKRSPSLLTNHDC